MKQFATAAAEIVRRVVETVEDEDFGLEDVYDVEPENAWRQIDGDFGDPWEYGGDWYNPARNEVLHFGGLEEEGDDADIDPNDVPVPDQMLAKLPPEQEDWTQNKDRDNAIDRYKLARAEFLNLRKQRPFWLIHVPGPDDAVFRRYDGAVARSWGFEPGTKEYRDYMIAPPEYKIVQVGRYVGFHELGHEERMTRQQARVLLGDRNL